MEKIAFLYDSVLDVGGVENHLLSILRKSDPAKNRYIIISNVSKVFRERTGDSNVEIVPLHQRHPLNPLTPFQIAGILRQKKVDLVHTHSPTASLWGRVAAYLVKKPCITTVHLPVDQYHGDLQTARARWGRNIYASMDQWLNFRQSLTQKIIYVSEEVYQRDISEGHSPGDRSVVIPNGIDLSRFARTDRKDARQHFNLMPNTKIAIFVGRLESQKKADILLKAISKIDLPEIDFRVWLVGDGPLADELKSKAKHLGIGDRVVFWGYQENVQLYLAAGDIFVLASKFEGMPIALLEAMAAGLPCVVTNVGEIKKLITHGEHGLVVPPEDPACLAEALRTLLTMSKLCEQMAKNAWEHAQRFSDKVMVDGIEKVYNDCLGNPSDDIFY